MLGASGDTFRRRSGRQAPSPVDGLGPVWRMHLEDVGVDRMPDRMTSLDYQGSQLPDVGDCFVLAMLRAPPCRCECIPGRCHVGGVFAQHDAMTKTKSLYHGHRFPSMVTPLPPLPPLHPARRTLSRPAPRHLPATEIAGVERDCMRSVNLTSGAVSAVVTSANTTRIV